MISGHVFFQSAQARCSQMNFEATFWMDFVCRTTVCIRPHPKYLSIVQPAQYSMSLLLHDQPVSPWRSNWWHSRNHIKTTYDRDEAMTMWFPVCRADGEDDGRTCSELASDKPESISSLQCRAVEHSVTSQRVHLHIRIHIIQVEGELVVHSVTCQHVHSATSEVDHSATTSSQNDHADEHSDCSSSSSSWEIVPYNIIVDEKIECIVGESFEC
jgi:hypothetical protein